jgi:MSHA pilin protein MshC
MTLATNHRISQSGFTIVELITVIVIVGILAVAALPRFFDQNVFESRGFYDQVVATLRFAQKAAIAQHRFVCVAFTSNSVRLTYDATAPSANYTLATCPGTPLTSPSGVTPYTITSTNASFTSVPADFSFTALGRPGAVVPNINITGYATPITVEAETGYVH